MLKPLMEAFGLHDHSTETVHHDSWQGRPDGGAEEFASSGIAEGTRIATERGWVPVEALSPGDRVLTFDSGLQPVLRIRRDALRHDAARRSRLHCPLAVPAGALGNQDPMLLLPRQRVMIESDHAEACSGDPFALVEAAALEGIRGITRIRPAGRINVYELRLADEQVIYANGSGLLHCPPERATVVPMRAIGSGSSEGERYPALTRARARRIVDDLKGGDRENGSADGWYGGARRRQAALG